MADVGNDNIGVNPYNHNAAYVYVSKFTAAATCNINGLTFYYTDYLANTPKCKWCMYDDAGDGTPGILRDVTVEWTAPNPYVNWKYLAFASGPQAIVNGTIYHLGFGADAILTYREDPSLTGNKMSFQLSGGYPAFPDPFTGNPIADRLISIYANCAAAEKLLLRTRVGVGL